MIAGPAGFRAAVSHSRILPSNPLTVTNRPPSGENAIPVTVSPGSLSVPTSAYGH